FTKATDEWFYLHAEKIAKKSKRIIESIPLNDYLFRYDRGAFWMGTLAFQRFRVPFTKFTKWVLNPLMKTRLMYNALQASGASQEYIVQDLALPEKTVVAFMQYVHKKFHIYPLWLCPLLTDDKSPLLSNYL